MTSWARLRRRAARRLPRVIFDFVDGGADDEVTLRRNRLAFDDLAFKGRLLGRTGSRSQATTLLGQRLGIPVLTAPTGLSRAAGPDGEVAAAVAATRMGTVSILSGGGSAGISEVARSTPEPQWFQLYLWRDTELVRRRLEEAKDVGFRTLVVTADVPVSGNRERDLVNGMSVPVRVRPRMIANVLRRPCWMWNYLAGPPLTNPYMAAQPSLWRRILPGKDPSLSSYVDTMFNADHGWDDLIQIRRMWDGPLVLKGVMCAEDALRAADAGCDGIIVSNHGGRQLDGLPASIEVLPEVVDAVGERVDVLLDSGVRRGSDVVKALALGAKACLVGRPWVFGLASGGVNGVQAVLADFASEIDRTLALIGATDIRQLDRSVLRRRPGFGWEDFPAASGACVTDTDPAPANSSQGLPVQGP